MKTAITSLFAVACLCFLASCKEGGNSAKPSGNPVSAPGDYLGELGKAQKSAQATLTVAGLDQAIKRFQVEQNRLPKDLNELVAKGAINQIPPPPRGMKYDYDAKTGIVKLVPE
jgi:hypothetical protein